MFNQIKTHTLIFVIPVLLTLNTGCDVVPLPFDEDPTPPTITKVDITDLTTQVVTTVKDQEYYPVRKDRKYRIDCYATDNQGLRSMQLVQGDISGYCNVSFSLFGPINQSYGSNTYMRLPVYGKISKEFTVPSTVCAIEKAPLYLTARNNTNNGQAFFIINLRNLKGAWGAPL